MGNYTTVKVDFNRNFDEQKIKEIDNKEWFIESEKLMRIVCEHYNNKIVGNKQDFTWGESILRLFGNENDNLKSNIFEALRNKIVQLQLSLSNIELLKDLEREDKTIWERMYYENVISYIGTIKDLSYHYINVFENLKVLAGSGFNNKVNRKCSDLIKNILEDLDLKTTKYRNDFIHNLNLFSDDKTEVILKDGKRIGVLKGATLFDTNSLEAEIFEDIKRLKNYYSQLLEALS